MSSMVSKGTGRHSSSPAGAKTGPVPGLPDVTELVHEPREDQAVPETRHAPDRDLAVDQLGPVPGAELEVVEEFPHFFVRRWCYAHGGSFLVGSPGLQRASRTIRMTTDIPVCHWQRNKPRIM